MKIPDLQKLIHEPELVQEHLRILMKNKLFILQTVDQEEIKGHFLKAEHNLRFVATLTPEFSDWALTGCYYSCYHAALALIQTKGYSSKNHFATLCIIIKEFYKKELCKEDIELFSYFLDYEDVLSYVETKNKREDATYSSKRYFDKKDVEKIRIKATLFVHKIQEILEEKGLSK
jgi:uncharacterized protein (UPF0332 family)